MKILTQQKLIAALREGDLDLRVSSIMIHAWRDKGMPTAPGGKKPRFIYEDVRAWILATRDSAPVVQAARDRVFRVAMRKGA